MRTSIRGTDWFTPWPLHLSTHTYSCTHLKTHLLTPLIHCIRTTHLHHTLVPTTPGPGHRKQPKATVEDVHTMQENMENFIKQGG